MIRSLVLLISLVTLVCAAAAHEEPLDRIATLTLQIESRGADPGLHHARGRLWIIAGGWKAAIDDLLTVRELDTSRPGIDFDLGRAYSGAGRFELALASIDAHLDDLDDHPADRPDDGPALLIRARALGRLQRYAESLHAYDRALAGPAMRTPQASIERARVAALAGASDEALCGLDEAMRELGPIVSLQLEAIEIELATCDWNAALSRVDEIRLRARRSERWHSKRGEILERAGRPEQAADAFAEALLAIAALPERHRTSHATVKLRDHAAERLARTLDQRTPR